MRAKFLLYTDLWIAICASLLCFSSSFVLKTYNFEVVIFVFFSTFSSYTFQRIMQKRPRPFICLDKSKIITWIYHILVLISFLGSIYFCLEFQFKTLILIAVITAISIFYPFYLRSIPRLKVFIISLVWSIITVGLLVIENDIQLEWSILLELFSRFFFILAITIPFDIRDIYYDSNRLQTIPQLFGLLNAKIISISSTLFFLSINTIQYYINVINSLSLLAIIFTSIISIVLILDSHPKKSHFFFGFWVEGLSALLFITLLLANHFI